VNISTLTTAGLVMLYQSIKIALEQDDQMPERRQFEIRENPEWRRSCRARPRRWSRRQYV